MKLFLVTIGAWSLVATALRVCVPSDYQRSYSPCSGGSRVLGYNKTATASCDGPASFSLGQTASCTCTLDEMVPVFGQCDQQSGTAQLLSYANGPGCTVNQNTGLLTGAPSHCPCNAGDLAFGWTSCVSGNGTRQSVPYWTRNCVQSPTSPLPPPATSPCSLSCASGEFVDPLSGVCSLCRSGSYSFSGKEWIAPYSKFPSDWFTSCTTFSTVPCPTDGWKVCSDGSCLYSGDLWGNDDVETALSFHVKLVTYPAALSFEWRVSSEDQADFFTIKIDGTFVKWASGDTTWSAFRYEFSAPTTQPCAWKVGGQCFFPNQLTPFVETSFPRPGGWNVPKERSFYAVADADACAPVGYVQCNAGSPMWAVAQPAGHCTVASVIGAAAAQRCTGLLVVMDGDLKGPSTGISDMQVGVMTVTAGQALLRDLRSTSSLTKRLNMTYDNDPGDLHTVVLIYDKDRSISRRRDRAEVRNIRISGLTNQATECLKCPPGSTSAEGASSCYPCPANRYSDEPGVAAPCKACPAQMSSPSGSTNCVRSLECTMADYVPTFGPCRVMNGLMSHQVTYALIQPPQCNITASSFVPPAPHDVPCGPCDYGGYRDWVSGQCVQCPPYMFFNASEHVLNQHRSAVDQVTPCAVCAMGWVPEQRFETHFSDTSEFPAVWKRECSSCIGMGWELRTLNRSSGDVNKVLGVGRGVLAGATATLTMNFTLDLPGRFDLQYAVEWDPTFPQPQVVMPTVSISIEDASTDKYRETTVVEAQLPLGSEPGVHQYTSPVLPRAAYVVLVKYVTSQNVPTPVSFSVRSLRVENARNGGAESCARCPAGYFCRSNEQAFPVPCPAGHYQEREGQFSCHQCLPFHVAEHEGSTRCVHCNPPLMPNMHNQYCVLPFCEVKFDRVLMSTFHDVPLRPAREPIDRELAQEFRLSGINYMNVTVQTNREGNASTSAQPRIQMTMCSPESSPCVAAGPRPISFGCIAMEDGTLRQLGDFMAVRNLGVPNRTSPGLNLMISGVPCPSDSTTNLQTNVTLLCDPTVETYEVVSAGIPQACLYNLTVRTRHACPMCTNQSFAWTETPCTGPRPGTKHRVYSYATPSGRVLEQPNCFGGISMPAVEELECPYATLTLDRKTGPWVAVLALSVVLLILCCGACVLYLYSSRKRLQVSYSALSSQAATNEMTEAPQRRAPSASRVLPSRHEVVDYDAGNEPHPDAPKAAPHPI